MASPSKLEKNGGKVIVGEREVFSLKTEQTAAKTYRTGSQAVADALDYVGGSIFPSGGTQCWAISV